MNNLRFFKEKEERNKENKYLKIIINNWFFSLFLELIKMGNNFV
jgi:hypothetical protein